MLISLRYLVLRQDVYFTFSVAKSDKVDTQLDKLFDCERESQSDKKFSQSKMIHEKVFLILWEVSLFLLTFLGPIFFLLLAYICNLYLLFKPFILSTITWSSYPKAFHKARKDVAR